MTLETFFRNKMYWTAVTQYRPLQSWIYVTKLLFFFYLSGLILRKPTLGWLTVTLEFSKGVIASL